MNKNIFRIALLTIITLIFCFAANVIAQCKSSNKKNCKKEKTQEQNKKVTPKKDNNTTAKVKPKSGEGVKPKVCETNYLVNLSRTQATISNAKIEFSITPIEVDGDIVIYSYTVSAGRIYGNGSKLIWDLSGVRPGTYAMTTRIDGCGSTIQTVSVRITE